MSELPTGTVTFLFTDIEGSTALLRELGERYARALSSHRRALHEAFSAHGGVEVDRQGDASFFAFQRAKDAIAAATEAQRTLEEGPVRVRMGIHTGEPVLTDGGYVGMDVHRAARIAAVGHGGQILVSQTTRDLLDDDLHDLGEHRLKDLTKPERLYQLSEGKFPPLRSLNFTNLPVQPTPLLGRERELAEAGELLGRNDVRLVTLVGPPGTGKTRLALAIAAEAVDEFEGGVWWVPLSTLRDSALVVPAIAQTLGAKGSLVEHLRRERTLLLLDNMEQVADAASELAELLRELDGVKLLVTSREPLHVAGEHEYPVLPLPDEAAIALFNERARSVRPDFPADQAVGEICARLDRLPLAIELAAARVKILEPDALLERLERRLPLLTLGRRDAPERQRTLRATIEWSYDLLTPGERRLFERLGVFAGGFTVEAAEEVSGASLDRLASLVDKSLVRQQEKGRFLLLETIREYALERLHEQADAADVHRSHRTYFFDIAERAAAVDSDITRYDRLRQDHHNFREALRSGFEAGDETALRLATSLSLYWLHSGYAIEGRRWLEAGLKRFPDDPALRSDALHRLCHMIAAHGDFDLAKKVAEERRTLCRRLGDTKGEADTLYVIGYAAEDRGQFEEARRLYDEAAGLTDLVDQESRARALGEYGRLASRQGNLEQAANLFQEALDLWRALGDDTSVAWKLQDLAEVAITSGDFPRARSLLRESISLSTGLGSQRQIGWWLETTAALFAHEGKAQQAARLFGAAEVTRGRMGETLDSFDVVFHDRAVAHLVAGIGETAYHEGVKLGAAMPTDAALDYALVSLD